MSRLYTSPSQLLFLGLQKHGRRQNSKGGKGEFVKIGHIDNCEEVAKELGGNSRTQQIREELLGSLITSTSAQDAKHLGKANSKSSEKFYFNEIAHNQGCMIPIARFLYMICMIPVLYINTFFLILKTCDSCLLDGAAF